MMNRIMLLLAMCNVFLSFSVSATKVERTFRLSMFSFEPDLIRLDNSVALLNIAIDTDFMVTEFGEFYDPSIIPPIGEFNIYQGGLLSAKLLLGTDRLDLQLQSSSIEVSEFEILIRFNASNVANFSTVEFQFRLPMNYPNVDPFVLLPYLPDYFLDVFTTQYSNLVGVEPPFIELVPIMFGSPIPFPSALAQKNMSEIKAIVAKQAKSK